MSVLIALEPSQHGTAPLGSVFRASHKDSTQ